MRNVKNEHIVIGMSPGRDSWMETTLSNVQLVGALALRMFSELTTSPEIATPGNSISTPGPSVFTNVDTIRKPAFA
jgi:hypothetical protein